MEEGGSKWRKGRHGTGVGCVGGGLVCKSDGAGGEERVGEEKGEEE